VLLECLDAPDVASVLVVGRTTCEVEHDKLEELLHDDFFDYASIADRLTGFDACLFCLGVSAAGMDEERYRHLTYDLTMAAARTLAERNPEMTFIYVSGAGTDSSEQGRMMWARVKGKTENHLQELPFKATYLFRPAFIQPRRGVRSKTGLYQALYTVLSPLSPVLKGVFPGQVTNTEFVGQAMLHVAREGAPQPIVENREINEIAASITPS